MLLTEVQCEIMSHKINNDILVLLDPAWWALRRSGTRDDLTGHFQEQYKSGTRVDAHAKT